MCGVVEIITQFKMLMSPLLCNHVLLPQIVYVIGIYSDYCFVRLASYMHECSKWQNYFKVSDETLTVNQALGQIVCT